MSTLPVVRVESWSKYPWLRHGFSTRAGGLSTLYGHGGTLNLGYTRDDDRTKVDANRALWLNAVGDGARFESVTVRQVHGTAMHVVTGEQNQEPPSPANMLIEADGLLTNHPGQMLGIQVADCVPVLVTDVRRRVVAAFHAGWRGTAAGIVDLGIQRMKEQFSSRTADLLAAIGPSIGPCCYTVGDEVRGEFFDRFHYAEYLFQLHQGETRLDLCEANQRQLLEAGLLLENISVVGECTACALVGTGSSASRKYFSHRAEDGVTGRAMGSIGIAG